MRSEVPDDIDIMLKQPQIHAQCIVVVQIAQFPFVDKFLDLPHRAGKQKGVVYHDLQILAFSKFNQFFRLSATL